MIARFRHRALKRYWTRGDVSGLRADWSRRIDRQLAALDQASKPDDVNVVGWGFHALTADRAGTYALSVSRNWRLTFAWDGQDAVDVDLEDYRGR